MKIIIMENPGVKIDERIERVGRNLENIIAETDSKRLHRLLVELQDLLATKNVWSEGIEGVARTIITGILWNEPTESEIDSLFKIADAFEIKVVQLEELREK